MLAVPVPGKSAVDILKAFCAWNYLPKEGSFAKTGILKSLPDMVTNRSLCIQKKGVIVSRQKGYCIQSWVEKRLLREMAFRIFTSK